MNAARCRRLSALAVVVVMTVAYAAEAPLYESLYAQRLKPLAVSDEPASCNECHLAGVDLASFLHDDGARTFLSLRDQGLVDLDDVRRSRILALIAMAKPDSPVVTQQMRQRELEAMTAFLEACVADADLVARPKLAEDQLARPAADNDAIRYMRSDQVQARFNRTLWAEIERCAACHRSPDNAKQAAQFGERVNWVVAGDPVATRQRMTERGYFDVAQPARSLVLLKPTLQVEHGGGPKMVIGDESYAKWLAWIEDWSRTAKGQYGSAADLPAEPGEVLVHSDIWVRMEHGGRWSNSAVAIYLRAWDAAAGDWEPAPIASATRVVEGPGWQQQLYLRAPAGSARMRQFVRDRRLPDGRYQVTIYVDASYQPQQGQPARFGPEQRVGVMDVERAWGVGYGRMNILPLPR